MSHGTTCQETIISDYIHRVGSMLHENENYRHANTDWRAREEKDTSIRIEAGVLAIYAVAEEDPGI